MYMSLLPSSDHTMSFQCLFSCAKTIGQSPEGPHPRYRFTHSIDRSTRAQEAFKYIF